MSVWEFSGSVRDIDALRAAYDCRDCVFCGTELVPVFTAPPSLSENSGYKGVPAYNRMSIYGCQICGWWVVKETDEINYFDGNVKRSKIKISAGAGSLRELDPADLSIHLQEVRDYLCAKYEGRFSLNPRKFEEVVADVFSDFGYTVTVTAFSADDGVDVILNDVEDATIGVQVKRYRNKIKVEQIRSLAGALVLGGHTKGIFVTTSSFQRGAARTTQLFKLRGVPIELVDAQSFYDALKIAQLQHIDRDWKNVDYGYWFIGEEDYNFWT